MSDRLILTDVSVSRGGHPVIDEVSATLQGGQIVAICGPNGAGKSSLLIAIAGLLSYSGRVDWDGQAPGHGDMAYMPQSPAIRAPLSALEVVLLGRIQHLGWRLDDADVDAAVQALETVGLAHVAQRRLGTLSGGQQQLVLLAQRLVRQPRLLLLDEPTSALDLSRQLLVLELLSGYARQTGALVVCVLHDLSLAARFAATLVMLNGGRLTSCGPPGRVLRPDLIRSIYDVETELLTTSLGHVVVAPLQSCERLSGIGEATAERRL